MDISSLSDQFNDLYMNEQSDFLSESEEEEEESGHVLTHLPESFMRYVNNKKSEFTGCDRSGPGNTLVIPEIPRRCFTNWTVGKQLARGQGAVVFKAGCEGGGSCRMIARISQLTDSSTNKTKKRERAFRRDVEARYRIECECKNANITNVRDAMICTTGTKRYGVTIAGYYDGGTVLEYLLTLSTTNQRSKFVAAVKRSTTKNTSKYA